MKNPTEKKFKNYFYLGLTVVTVAYMCLLGVSIGAYFTPPNKLQTLQKLKQRLFNSVNEIDQLNETKCDIETCILNANDTSELQSDIDLFDEVFNITVESDLQKIDAVAQLDVESDLTIFQESLNIPNATILEVYTDVLNGNSSFQFAEPNGLATVDSNNTLFFEQLTSAHLPVVISSDNQILEDEKWQITYLLDTSSQELKNLTLLEGTEGNVVTLSLLFKRGARARIKTLPYGTLLLTQTDSIKSLTFLNGVWKVLNSQTNSFYVTEQQGDKLVGGTFTNEQFQGRSVSLSADGNTLAMGGPQFNAAIGATWIFVRNQNGQWSQQGSELIGGSSTDPQSQGAAVSLSADGNTLAVGAPAFSGDEIGETWIFIRDQNGNWAQQGNSLIGSDGIGTQQQGQSVALSADGNTLAVGGPEDNSQIGATWIFVFNQTATTWTQQGNKLVGTGGVGIQKQGQSVSLSADGNTLAVGGPFDDSNIGATWIFVRDRTENWIQEGNKLIGTGGLGIQQQGWSVSLSADGNTLALGATRDNADVGATWVFVRIGNQWRQQGPKLVSVVVLGDQEQGSSVSLSADGNTLAVGADEEKDFVGATYIFVRTEFQWEQINQKLVGGSSTNTQRQGFSVSLSADGNTLAVGAPTDPFATDQIGGTWIFV